MSGRAWVCALAATAAIVAASTRPPLEARGPSPRTPPHRVRAALHVHTGHSEDGRGSVLDVVAAARRARIPVVVITDHNTEASRSEDGWHRDVLVVTGMEKSTNAGHALVMGTPPLTFRLDGDPLEVMRDVIDLGGFVVAAHPRSTHPERRWTGPLAGLAGLEVLNFGQRESWPGGASLAPVLLRYPADPARTLLDAFAFSRDAIRLWDQVLASRPAAGLIGLDAHGGIRSGGKTLPFPSHRTVLGLASQHLLLPRPLSGDAASDRALVLEAVRQGRGFAAVDALADATRFTFTASGSGVSAGPGDSVSPAPGLRVRADSGGVKGARLVLLHDGRPVAEGDPVETIAETPGVYRAEGYVGRPSRRGDPLPWLITNPIYVFTPGEQAARVARANAPIAAPAEAPPPDVLIDDFTSPSPRVRWHVDRSPDAAGDIAVDGGALRFRFALGGLAPTHASVVVWEARRLAPSDSVVLRVRADRRFRFDVQVRVRAPDRPGGVAIWRRSVRAEAEWHRMALPLASLATYDTRAGAPRWDEVVGIYVHVDESHLEPGARGTIWIDEVGLSNAPPPGETTVSR